MQTLLGIQCNILVFHLNTTQRRWCHRRCRWSWPCRRAPSAPWLSSPLWQTGWSGLNAAPLAAAAWNKQLNITKRVAKLLWILVSETVIRRNYQEQQELYAQRVHLRPRLPEQTWLWPGTLSPAWACAGKPEHRICVASFVPPPSLRHFRWASTLMHHFFEFFLKYCEDNVGVNDVELGQHIHSHQLQHIRQTSC